MAEFSTSETYALEARGWQRQQPLAQRWHSSLLLDPLSEGHNSWWAGIAIGEEEHTVRSVSRFICHCMHSIPTTRSICPCDALFLAYPEG